MLRSTLLAACTALCLGALATGCTAGNDDVVVVSRNAPIASTLTVDWTVDGTKDPSTCSVAGANVIEISVQDLAGNEVGAFQQRCGVFATSITLDSGNYAAYAVLLDVNNQPRTTEIAISPFTLRGNDELVIPIDFPADSFF